MTLLGEAQEPERFAYSDMAKGNTPLSYIEFIHLVQEILVIVWGEDWRNRFGPEAPQSHSLDNPYIKYKLISRKPSTQIKGQTEPRLRGHMRDTKDESNALEIWGQLFDCVVEFDCVAPTPAQADSLMDQFEEFMLSYRSLFIKRGVHKLLFIEQLEDGHSSASKESSYSRALRYYVRIDKVVAIPVQILESVDSHISLHPPKIHIV